MARRWRVYHAELEPRAGVDLTLAEDEAHHVRRVLRLSSGDRLAVFDGRGNEWEAEILHGSSDAVTVRLTGPLEDAIEAPLDVTLFQGLCKADRMEWVIQKATELGLSAVRPFGSKRAERYAIGPRRLERWRRITVESCKQSGRRRLPLLEPCATLPAAEGRDTLALLLDPAEGAEPLASLTEAETPPRVWLAAGPQAGFAGEEIENATAAGWRRVRLGPRVLRTDTAGLVAAAIVLHRWADLGR